MQNYSSLRETNENEEDPSVLVHVAEPSRARWNHIHDLDTFFSRMYKYHQLHGFTCMVVKEISELAQFIFVVFLACYVPYGIRYDVLFDPDNHKHKLTISDILLPLNECMKKFPMLIWFLLFVSLIVWIFKLIKGLYNLFYFWDIKQFYNIALKIDDKQLDNLTWHEIQKRVLDVQIEQQMCIHKRELSELDIYHRILRQQNYFIAMVNKHLIPPRINIPIINKEYVYWTNTLQLNIQILFFWSPWAPFENSWHLRADYKRPNLRHDLSNELGKQILWLAFINAIFAPLIFLWSILYAFFNYAAVIRREPGTLAMRRWSLYGKLYIRHFNELDHELQARLTRAHKPATKYFLSFMSSMSSIIAESVGFFIAAILAVLFVLTIYDEDVLNIEGVLALITILTCLLATLRKMIPDETVSIDIKRLLSEIVLDIHYLPDGWRTEAHTSRIRNEFSQLFQYAFVGLLEGILSPILTPYILLFHIYPKRLDFVDFFRNFTVTVVGVGDVCSFAQMDIKKHGNPEWNNTINEIPPQYNQAEDGKTELSLMHFAYTNPTWKPTGPESINFISNVQEQNSLIKRTMQQSTTTTIQGINNPDELDREQMASMILYGSGPENDNELYLRNTYGPSHGWSTDGPSQYSHKDMALSMTYLHNQHSQKTTSDRVNVVHGERSPLLPSSNH